MAEKHRQLPRVAYSYNEAAEVLGLSAGFLRLEVQRGRLHALHAGRRRLILADELSRYLRQCDASAGDTR